MSKSFKTQNQVAWNSGNMDELQQKDIFFVLISKFMWSLKVIKISRKSSLKSIYWWVVNKRAVLFQNNIPVFSPALTDGSLGDMIYFHSYKNPGLILDIVEGKSNITATAGGSAAAVSAQSVGRIMSVGLLFQIFGSWTARRCLPRGQEWSSWEEAWSSIT